MPINLDHTTATFSTDSGPLTIGIDSAVRIPVGAQAARPVGLAGHLRFDTDTNQFEGFDGTQWGPLAGSVNSTTDVPEGTNLYYTNERVDDRVSNLLIAGTGITLTYDDNANTLTIDGSNAGIEVRDEGTLLTNATAFDFVGLGVSATDVGGGVVQVSVTGAGIGSTDDVPEGSTNLYYTDTRVNSAIDTRVTKSFIDALNVDADTLDGNDSTFFQRRTTIADAPPAGSQDGDMWVDCDTGELYVYYNDGDSSQWVGINAQSSANISSTSPFVDTGTYVYYGGPRNVGIGTSIPAQALDVVGNIQASGDVIAYSDMRLKNAIVTMDDGLDVVKQLRGVRFTRKKAIKRQVGLIAQEVQEVLPEAVYKDEETGYLGVSYGNIVGVLVEAIKSQQEQIDELRRRIANRK